MGKLRLAAALAVWLGWSLAGQAALTANDHADIARAEGYLNGISTLRARILQVAPDGSTSEGTLSLQRPGHLRLDYDPPSPIVIYGDSDWLVYRDKELDQTSYVDIDSSPAGLLIKPHLALEGDGLAVTGVTKRPGVLEITVIKQADPRQGRITLVFTEQPFQLKQWHVVDAQGQTTTVSLFDPHLDAKFDSNWFTYRQLKGF